MGRASGSAASTTNMATRPSGYCSSHALDCDLHPLHSHPLQQHLMLVCAWRLAVERVVLPRSRCRSAASSAARRRSRVTRPSRAAPPPPSPGFLA